MADGEKRSPGSLTIVGTGIRTSLQTTSEARSAIEKADKVLYLLDPVGARWVQILNPTAESLDNFYSIDRPRLDTYRMMVEEIMAWVRKGLDVCVAFYGHPGVFVDPSHDAIRRAQREGFEARMMPGVSAEDCLIADLGFDPGQWGLHSYEATEFLLHRRVADPSVHLILWQVGALGEMRARKGPNPAAFGTLVDRLAERYGSDHEVVLYQASPYPIGGSSINRLRLADLVTADVSPMSTLYVPPAARPASDLGMAEMFGWSPSERA
ncbi:MAG TPA: SAM-dependent methyltransferase [Actinomycetota bacterium]|nr:SAM-dependent methyltransferase [Actinomycetota bacterium]